MVPTKSTLGVEIRFKMDIFDVSIEHGHVFPILSTSELHSGIFVCIFESAVKF